MEERLQKIIANRGYCSRRKAEELIKKGKVSINGKVITELGVKVHPNTDIEVEGIPLEKPKLVYYLLHKPKDYISSVKDEKGRKVVTELIQTNTADERVYPVGRLDRNTTGILLLTNDGEFMQAMTHPKFHIQKVYLATVEGIVSARELAPLTRGVEIEKGVKVAADEVFVVNRNKQKETSTIEITIHDGKYHQVKKMFESIGHAVKQLKRVKYGNLTIDNLPVGAHRQLKKTEVAELLQLAKDGNNS